MTNNKEREVVMRQLRKPAAIASLLAISCNAFALPILQDIGNGVVQINAFEPVGQSFTAEDPFVTFGFWFEVINPGVAPADVTISLLDGVGNTGNLLLANTFSMDAGFMGYRDVDFSPVSLQIGSQYTALLSIPDDNSYWGLRLYTGFMQTDLYTGGQIVFGGRPGPFEEPPNNPLLADARFRVTPVEAPVPVPEPSSIWLLAIGLMMMGSPLLRRSTLQ